MTQTKRKTKALTVQQVKDIILEWYKELLEEDGGYDRRTKESLGKVLGYIRDLLEGVEGEI